VTGPVAGAAESGDADGATDVVEKAASEIGDSMRGSLRRTGFPNRERASVVAQRINPCRGESR
jgi:hypothetical protein